MRPPATHSDLRANAMINQSRPLSIVFAGGGTAGHLFPAIAAAEQVQRLAADARIVFAGSGRAIEQTHVAAAGFDYVSLPSRPLPRSMGDWVPFVVENLAGYWAACRLLADEGTDVVVGLGGYACAPTARAAIRLGVPLVLLEQNVLPGRATRWLARRAAAVCSAWAPAKTHLPPGARVWTTGNPLRAAFFEPAEKKRLLLVLGGSHGAHALNIDVPKALYRVASALKGWRIVHQTGEADRAAVERLYRRLGLDAEITPFIADMPRLMRSAQLAVSRAGGTTLSELAATGTPAVLVPYPHAADDHQRRNAELLARAGGAVIVEQCAAQQGAEAVRFDVALADALRPLLLEAGQTAAMGRVMRRFARPEAARQVARIILQQTHARATLPAAA